MTKLNLANLNETKLRKQFPIDLVYLWCDGGDPDFIARKNLRQQQFNGQIASENIDELRYTQHDELKYSLRSVEKNAPWINHIYIVTDNQKPKWLKPNPKITIIDHKEIIPDNIRPVFSAIVIEMYISKIPGLSEHFLFANDDMFFYKTVTPQDFFSDFERPIVWLSKMPQLSKHDVSKVLDNPNRTDWYKTAVRAWQLFSLRSQTRLPFYYPAHSIDSYTKKIYDSTLEKYPELLSHNRAPFRTGNEICRLIFCYEMIHSFHCKFFINQKINLLTKILSLFTDLKLFSIYKSNPDKLDKYLTKFNPKTFCCNTINTTNEFKTIKLFEKLYPQKSQWEV